MSDILSSAEEVFGKGVTVVFGTMFKQEAMNLSSLAMGGEFISATAAMPPPHDSQPSTVSDYAKGEDLAQPSAQPE